MKIKEIETLFKAYTTLVELPSKDKSIELAMNSIKVNINSLLGECAIVKVTPVIKISDEVRFAQSIADDRDTSLNVIVVKIMGVLNIKKRPFIKRMGMSITNISHISKYLNGERKMTNKIAYKIKEALGSYGVDINLEPHLK